MPLTSEQQAILLKGLNGSRVAKRKGGGGMQLSYLEAWDVKAHLIRVFGFCNFSADVLSAELMFEDGPPDVKNWSVGYKVILRLTIETGGFGAVTYTEAAVGSASLPNRGEAHDMAIKTAESDALKRAAVYLGDQFGLSLYNNGSLAPVVKLTVAGVDGPSRPVEAPDSAEHNSQASHIDEDIEGLYETLQALEGEGDAEKRILAVAAFKAEHPGILTHNLPGPNPITVARYLDLIAAGHYLPKGDTDAPTA